MLKFAFLSTILASSLAHAEPVLSPDAFLAQVRSGNGALKAALESSQGSLRRSGEASLLLSPTFFANAAALDDAKPTSNALIQGDKTVVSSLSAGVSQQTSFGLQAKFSYLLSHSSISGASPLYVPNSSVYDAKPTLELNQSLWRNGFGRETRGTQQLLRSQAMAVSHGERFKAKATLAEAEVSYWRLVAARKAVEHQRESVSRAEKMRQWAERRAELQLTDRSDLLQSEAALQARKLELAQALDEELSSSRAFNTLRGTSSDDVPETLADIDSVDFSKLRIPERTGSREDLLAAEMIQSAAAASAEVALERNSPTLDLFASLTLAGREAGFSESATRSLSLRNPTFSAGLKFIVPLDLQTLRETRAGFEAEHAAAESLLERKRFEQEREWTDLQKRYQEARGRLEIAQRLEKLQKEKFIYEKDRQTRGRSTMFQALLFEQEYALAQLSHLRVQTEVLKLHAQLKTFASSTGDE